MARSKTFDPEHAVDAAMRVFWRTGYEATSIDDLTRACGIGRGSMYATFGSKDALYDRALEHYQDVEGVRVAACLDREGTARERIAGLFGRFASEALDDPENRGCFILNAALERGGQDPAVARRVREALGGMEDGLEELVREGQDAGDLAADLDPRVIARYLVTALNGVRVTAKATRDRALVADAVRVALSVLGPEPV